MSDRAETGLAVGVRDGTVPSELVGGEWITPDGREPDATVTYADPGWVWWARGRMGQAPTYDEARRAAEGALGKGGSDAWPLEGVRELMAPVYCPHCDGAVADPASGCERCEVFLCPRCTRWTSWDEGCGDTVLCDSCWAEREEVSDG